MQLDRKRISVSEKHPSYFEYNGVTTLLLGGSREDNLFQIPDIREQLLRLKSAGGNYVRCTMSSRDPGDVWPYEKVNGIYDLNQPSAEFWRRFSEFLNLTSAMDIILQIEVWDRFDFAREFWQDNPFNAKNNINYTVEESSLAMEINTHPGQNENRFFFTIPDEDNNTVILRHQKKFVDRMLSYSLKYPNVLYCMDNETSAVESWGRFWSDYIKAKAEEQGVQVLTTEMWDPWDLSDPMHSRTFDHPELYRFCEISQNSHNSGDDHYQNILNIRKRIGEQRERPLTSVKIYGSSLSRFGSEKDAIERFWRNVFGKLASSRFHRPQSGIGLSDMAVAQIRSMRMLEKAMSIPQAQPANELLMDRELNQAYCLENKGIEIAVYLPKKTEITVDTRGLSGSMVVTWLHIDVCRWAEVELYDESDHLELEAPFEGDQVALIRPV